MKLLLEIGTEELPAAFIPGATGDLSRLLAEGLAALHLGGDSPRVYATPRRLTAIVDGLPSEQPVIETLVRGPSRAAAFDPEGRPTKAALGFARGQGVAVQDLVLRETPSGEYVFANRREAGRPTIEVLANFLPSLIQAFPLPRSMRWGSGETRFLRPIRWILALLDDRVIPFRLGEIESGRETRGHRTMARGILTVPDAESYVEILGSAGVIVDPEERRRIVVAGAERLAAEVGGVVGLEPELLEEVVNLIEYPTPFRGDFPSTYLAIPEPILVTTMARHQRYFPVRDHHGRLAPYFIGVRNGPSEYLEEVRRGNEKVLRARLADAEFFFQADLRHGLDRYRETLGGITYQERLGSLAEKTARLEKLAVSLLRATPNGSEEHSEEHLRRAASLAKADLASQVVREYPELQGEMGAIYARLSGEPEPVVRAIAEQYLPRGPESAVPESRLGQILAVADKLDSLAGGFLVGLAPTGSQDPYGLRRQALGVLRILLGGLPLNLTDALHLAFDGYEGFSPAETEAARRDLNVFFATRLESLLTELGEPPDNVAAVLAAGFSRVDQLPARLRALREIREEPEFIDLFTAYRRASRLAEGAEGEILPALFSEEAERGLYESLRVVGQAVEARLAAEDYLGYLRDAAALRAPLDHFLTAVLVMAEDENVRRNRLALLGAAVRILGRVADLSLLAFRSEVEGDRRR